MKADSAPTLETERLRLRAHRPGDFGACAAMWADPGVTRYIGGKAFTRADSWSKMLRYAGLWPLLGYGYWALEEKSTGLFVGDVGFADFKREIEPPIEGVPELGWALASPAQGRGYATEALRAALAWGDAHLETKRTVCLIDPANVASLRVAAKLGYRQTHRTSLLGNPSLLFERLS